MPSVLKLIRNSYIKLFFILTVRASLILKVKLIFSKNCIIISKKVSILIKSADFIIIPPPPFPLKIIIIKSLLNKFKTFKTINKTPRAEIR